MEEGVAFRGQGDVVRVQACAEAPLCLDVLADTEAQLVRDAEGEDARTEACASSKFGTPVNTAGTTPSDFDISWAMLCTASPAGRM